MASRGSPLRAHLPRRQQPSISSAASAHLRHLHQVATWASLFVSPLGAFLGSHLASTSEFFGCPPPSSPHSTCQRCESILQVGINCSVRVRTRKLKKRGTVTKGVSAPINSIIYSCQYCAFESMMSGTSKAFVKTKLSEEAARRKLSEPYQSLDVSMAEEVTQPTKMNSSEVLSSPKVLSTEIPGSTSKRTKRKGWLSLKQLAASSADSSPAGSRPIFSPLLPQLRRLDSARVLPTVSQVDLKCLTTTLGIEGEFLSSGTSIETTLELDPSEGDSEKVVSYKAINADLPKLEQSISFTAHVVHSSGDTTSICIPRSGVSDSSGVVATNLWSDADVIRPISRNVICSENAPNAADTYLELQQTNASGITMKVEEEGLQQKLSNHHSDADAAMLEQFSLRASVSKSSVHDTISMFEAQCNLSGAASRTDLEIVAPTSSILGLGTDEDATFNWSSFKSVVDANLPLMVENGIDYFDDKALDFRVNEEEATTNKIITVNSSIVKAVPLKNRQRDDDDDNWCKVVRKQENCKPEADSFRLGELDIKETSCTMPAEISGSICKNINTQTVHERKVQSRTKKKPLFRRVGRQWFTICKSNSTLKWRII